MNILVLGAGGFIGSHITERLALTDRISVIAFDRDIEKLKEVEAVVPELSSKVKIVKGDLSHDMAKVWEMVRWSDVTIDLIAYANPSFYVKHPLEVVRVNFFDNLEVVKACVEYGKHLIQFSSCEVYGITAGRNEKFSEDDSSLVMGPIREHRWIYASAKQLLERMVHAYGLEKNLAYTIIRPFNFIGPRIDYIPKPETFGGPRVFSHFMSALLHDTPIYLVNGGEARRSYTYIDDAIDGFMAVLRGITGPCYNQIINIGNPDNEVSIKNLALTMISLWQELTHKETKCQLISVSGEEFYGVGYADCDRRIPDVRRLTALGWAPKHSLQDALRKTMRYYIEKHEPAR